MQWLSLFLVLGAGTATLLTADPRFVMIKPSVIYTIVGVVMLKPGWMNRYLPPIAIEVVPDIAVIFGYVWAGLMFFSAALNLIVALNFSVATWAAFMSVYGIVSKARAVPDRLRHHAHDRPAPPPRPDGAGAFLIRFSNSRSPSLRAQRSNPSRRAKEERMDCFASLAMTKGTHPHSRGAMRPGHA